MNFFDIILSGSIPLNVIESMDDINTNLNNYNYLKINEYKNNKHDNSLIDMTKLLQSKLESRLNSSTELNRNKIHQGLYKLLNSATNDALNKNRNQLLTLLNEDKNIDNVIYQFAHDLSNSIVLLINGSDMNENSQEIFTNIIHLTGLTNKTINELLDIEKKLVLQL